MLQRFYNPPCRIDLPRSRDPIVVLYLEGPIRLELDQRGSIERRWVERGQMSLIPAGRPIRCTIKGKHDIVVVHVATDLMADVAFTVYGVAVHNIALIPRLAIADVCVDGLCRALLTEAERGGPGTGYVADKLARSLVTHLFRCHSDASRRSPRPPPSSPSVRLRRVIDFMAIHVDEAMPLSKLAAISGLSPSQFRRSFKEATGKSPHQFLSDLRIEKACELLGKTDIPVNEISLKCGFEWPNYFSSTFRESTGMTPRDWRNERKIGGQARDTSSDECFELNFSDIYCA